ncbi:MAG: hypothetical protein ABIP48_13270 [Planctomycetota bacterium]
MWKRLVLGAVALVLCATVAVLSGAAEKKQGQKKAKSAQAKAAEKEKEEAEAKWAPAVKPKPLGENVKRGLAWLVDHQLPSGVWGQGEESAQMRSGTEMKDVASVADTCSAALALIRSGSTPSKGPYAKNLLKAVDYVCSEIEGYDEDSLYITSTRGTRLQGKLGPYVDTFMASLMLSEVQGNMPNKKSNKRVDRALDNVLEKLTKHQRSDGTWDDRGWAATLSQGLAVKGLNRAAQQGKMVDEKVRQKAEQFSRKAFDRSTGKFSMPGSAGVELYAAGSNLGAVADSVNTNQAEEAEVRKAVKTAPTATERQEAEAKLDRFAAAKQDLDEATAAVVRRLDDKQFIAGFGSNGGEEFLSYMNIGEALVVKGGDEWKSWDKSITENLDRIQNKDGSWTGHHCVTGRTFCTSAALLVLMVDRTPVPIAAKIGRR